MGRAAGLLVMAMVLGAAALEAQGGPPPGRGRPLQGDGQQALTFGDLLSGLPHTVLPTDPVGAAQIRVTGRGGTDVLVAFLLPSALTGAGGAAVPLSFGPGAAGYSAGQDIDSQVAFDPAVPVVFALPEGSGRAMLYLGGTASPPPQTPAGSYSGTITLTISYVGN